MVNIKRVRNLKAGISGIGPVLYWMSREQRVSDNWALAYAIEIAENKSQPLMVAFCLDDSGHGITLRQYDFLIRGLKKVEVRLQEMNIPFTVLKGAPDVILPNFIRTHKISHLVMDFDPLRISREVQKKTASMVDIQVDLVDAHNIVPCFIASEKEEYSASTFRRKIRKLLPEFMDEFPPLMKQPLTLKMQRTQWEAITISFNTNRSVKPVEWLAPGETGARAMLEKFINERLPKYAAKRNDPNENCVSGLSPYLHFGQISSQRIALDIIAGIPRNENTDSFLEELIIRKELSDNFCYYNRDYDKVSAFRSWAVSSLTEHLADKREFIYTADQFEAARTHDTLWNAAQQEILNAGYLNGYLRMYWAKKILEWTENPEEALKVALYLNDKYQLDGRDPNGYVGCAWSIGGVHDRAWADREIFGKIRYMNRAGCERKFDVSRYIKSVNHHE